MAGPLGRLYAAASEALGPDDPHTLDLGHSLGLTLERLGQFEAARTTYGRLLEGYQRVQGKHGRAVGDLLGHLGDVARKSSDPVAAHHLYGQALTILRRQPGPEDPDALELVARDVEALRAMGRPVAARNRLRGVVEGYRRTLGEDNFRTRRAQSRLEAITPRRRSRARSLDGVG